MNKIMPLSITEVYFRGQGIWYAQDSDDYPIRISEDYEAFGIFTLSTKDSELMHFEKKLDRVARLYPATNHPHCGFKKFCDLSEENGLNPTQGFDSRTIFYFSVSEVITPPNLLDIKSIETINNKSLIGYSETTPPLQQDTRLGTPSQHESLSDTIVKKQTRVSQLHKLIWRIYNENRESTAHEIWLKLKNHHKEYDHDEIIEDVTPTVIFWHSSYGNPSQLKRKSFDSLLSKLKKNPLFK